VSSRFAPVRRLISAGIELVGRATPGAHALYPSMAEIFTCLPSVYQRDRLSYGQEHGIHHAAYLNVISMMTTA
jgi:hypothetical protein